MHSLPRSFSVIPLCGILLLGGFLRAQGVPVLRFTVQEGLAQSRMSSLAQDDRELLRRTIDQKDVDESIRIVEFPLKRKQDFSNEEN